MNIYIVIENQFPETELIMICACNDSDQAVTAYRRLWEPNDSQISACIHIGECNATEPSVLWKNFLTEPKIIQDEQEDSTEENTDKPEETTTS
jgi:hypothetical protein